MTLKMLRYLVLAVDAGSLRAASEQAGVTQPTLSAQLARLEDAVEQVLLERDRHGVRPTPVGERVVQQARLILREVEQVHTLCRTRVHPLAGQFRLGVIPTVGTYILPALLPFLRRDYPETDLHVRDAFTADLMRGLKDATLDAALLSLPLNDPAITHVKLMEEPFYAILPGDHALAQREQITRADLLGTDLLLLEEGHCLRAQTESYCSLPAHHRVIQATTVESLRLMVSSGLGCSILPRMAVSGRYARHAGVVVRPFADPVPSRTVVLAWRQSYHAYGELNALAKRLRRIFREAA